MKNALRLSVPVILSILVFGASIPLAFAATPGDVIINEFSSASGTEWVELLNTTGADINLTGWTIQDSAQAPKSLSSLGTIPANGIVVFEQASGWLNNIPTVETITIFDNSSTPIHSVSYGSAQGMNVVSPAAGQSGSFDGTNWSISSTPTKGWFNGAPAPSIATIVASIVSGGVTTNMGTIDNPSATPVGAGGLYFEKTGFGRITFTASLNLTNASTSAFLQNLGTYMNVSAGSMGFDARTATLLKNAGAEIKMYGLNALGFTGVPNIVVKNDTGTVIPSSDGTNYPALSGITYDASANSGTLTFGASHFTTFETKKVINTTTGVGYNTIKEAVDDASTGDTINVAAGTYHESQIVIDGTTNSELHGITLQGAGADSTFIDGDNAAAVNLGGGLHAGTFYIKNQSALVKIDGFTFRNPVTASSIADIAIAFGSGAPTTGSITISNNHFIGVSDGSNNLTDNAIWVYNAPAEVVSTITGNEFDHQWQSIILELPKGGAVITGNDFHNLFTSSGMPSQAMSLWQYGGTNVTAPVTISTNTFSASDGWSIVLRGGGSGNAQFVNNVTIQNNVITSTGSNSAGIVLRNPASTLSDAALDGIVGATISGNTLNSSVAGQGKGIWLRGPNNNNTISENSITGFEKGLANEEYNVASTTQNISAAHNYWGSADPSFGTIISGNVSYSPWWVTSSGPDSAAPGAPTLHAIATPSNNVLPTFAWDGVTAAPAVSTYHLVITNPDASETVIDQASTSYTPASDLPDGSYAWKVLAHNSMGDGSYSGTGSFTVDTAAPVISSVSHTPTTGTRKIGDTITLTINADATGYTAGAITLNGVVVTGFTSVGGGVYTATYTVVSGNTDRADSAQIPVSVVLTDTAGNSNDPFTAAPAAGNSPAIDANSPALSSVTVSSNNASNTKAKPGDVVTLAFTGSEALGTPAVTIAGHSGAGVTVSGSGTSWTATTTMILGDTEGAVPFTINFSDTAGNAGTQVTSVTPGSLVVFDKTSVAPASFAAGSPTQTSLALSWTNNELNGSYYTIKRSTSPITSGNFDAATTLGGAPTVASGVQGYVAKNLSAGTTYYFAVKMTDVTGNVSTMNTASGTTASGSAPAPSDTTAPAAVTDLGAMAGAIPTSQIVLDWSATGDDGSTGIATAYVIKRSSSAITASNFDAATTIFNAISPSAPSSPEMLTVGGLAPGTQYCFAVKVQDEASNTSAISNSECVTTSANLPSVASVGPATGQNDGAVGITITGTNFVDGANTVRLTNSSNTFDIVGTYTSDTEVTATIPIGVPAGVYGVRVINANGTSEVLASAYTVTNAPTPIPSVTDAVPSTIGTNDSDVNVEIYGTGFTGATGAVLDTGAPTVLTNFTVVSATKITATIPGTLAAGTYNVKVTNASGTNTVSAVQITVNAPVVINSSTSQDQETDKPIDLGNTSTIPVQITMNSNTDDSTLDNNTTIKVVIPPATVVTDANGDAYTGNINPPQLVKPTEEIAAEAGEGAVVITMGNPEERINFSNDFVVTVTLEFTNGTAPLIWYYNPLSGLEIAGKDGTKDGVTYAKGGTVLNAVNNGGTYTYTIGLLLDHMSSYVAGVTPTIASISPISNETGASFTITGTNFSPGAVVRFGSTVISSSVDTTESITGIVPPLGISTSHTVSVTNSDNLSATYPTAFSITAPIVVATGGGGGGGVVGLIGGGGGGGYQAPAPTAAALSAVAQPAQPQGQVLGAAVFNFAKSLGIGSRGDDVTELQKVLISGGYLKVSATGYFGPATRAAVKEYQKANGLEDVGVVGPKTRALLNQGKSPAMTAEARALLIQQLQAQLQVLLQKIKELQSQQT